jgi:hypothetical protein
LKTESSHNHGRFGIIHLRLRELGQLFNSMDPSPFLDRDLDANAEAFIATRAREFPPGRPVKLIIHVTGTSPTEKAADIESAVQHHFAERAESKWREFRLLMRQGRTSLAIGLLFLAACLTISNLLERLADSPLAGIVNESFLIVGWVAMWRPLEIYLYDWWPLRAERRVFTRLSRMQVELVMPATG